MNKRSAISFVVEENNIPKEMRKVVYDSEAETLTYEGVAAQFDSYATSGPFPSNLVREEKVKVSLKDSSDKVIKQLNKIKHNNFMVSTIEDHRLVMDEPEPEPVQVVGDLVVDNPEELIQPDESDTVEDIQSFTPYSEEGSLLDEPVESDSPVIEDEVETEIKTKTKTKVEVEKKEIPDRGGVASHAWSGNGIYG